MPHQDSQYCREFFENSVDAIFMVDITPDGRFRVAGVNPAGERLSGRTNSDVAGKFLEDAMPSAPVEAIRANFQRCIAAGRPVSFDEALDFAFGLRHLNTTLLPIRDDAGRIYRIAGLVRDITGQEQHEEQFVLLNFALNHVQEAVFLIDEKARFHYVNDNACQVLGYPRHELLRLGVGDVDPDWPSERWPEHWSQLMHVRTLIFEGRHKARDGRIFPVEISANYFEFGGHGYNLALVRDISERKRTENQLRLLDEALNRIREPAYIIHRDDMRFLYVNDEACRALGYSRDEMLRMTVFDIDPDYTPEIADIVRREADTSGMVTLERRHQAKDGHIFPVEINTSIFEYAGKKVSIVLSRDITERKQAEMALQRLNATLEQRVREEVARNREKDHLLIQQSRLAAMGEMIHNIAHQWRQPLNALGLLLANIQDSHEFDELTTEQLRDMVAKGTAIVRQMSATIDDFRNFFRPNKEKSDFAIGQCLREIRDILGGTLASQGIALEEKMDGEIILHGHKNEFAQVLINIISNAKEAIAAQHPEGGRITISVTRTEGAVEVRITDNGGGIPQDILPKIFDPYFTTKEKGTGIGLYMSKMIVEGSMGGEISARNMDGGAEFTLRLLEPSQPLANTAKAGRMEASSGTQPK